MNNDLISREALKEAVDTWDKFGYTAQGELIRLTEKNKDLYVPYVKYQDIVNCIDNAPTVFDCRSCKNNGNERECVDCHDYSNYVRYENRPQGEWGRWVISEIRCLNCLEYFQTDCYSMGELDKCPNCGAKLKGGAE